MPTQTFLDGANEPHFDVSCTSIQEHPRTQVLYWLYGYSACFKNMCSYDVFISSLAPLCSKAGGTRRALFNHLREKNGVGDTIIDLSDREKTLVISINRSRNPQ